MPPSASQGLKRFSPLLFGMEPSTAWALSSFSRAYDEAQLSLFPELAQHVARRAPAGTFPDVRLLVSRAFHILGLKIESTKIDLIKIVFKAGEDPEFAQYATTDVRPSDAGAGPPGGRPPADSGPSRPGGLFGSQQAILSRLQSTAKGFIRELCTGLLGQFDASRFLTWPDLSERATGGASRAAAGASSRRCPVSVRLMAEKHSLFGTPAEDEPESEGSSPRCSLSGRDQGFEQERDRSYAPALEERAVFVLSCLLDVFDQLRDTNVYLVEEMRSLLRTLPLVNSASILKALKRLVVFISGKAYSELLAPCYEKLWGMCGPSFESANPLSPPGAVSAFLSLFGKEGADGPTSPESGELTPQKLRDLLLRGDFSPISLSDLVCLDQSQSSSRQSADCVALSLFSGCVFGGLPLYRDFFRLLLHTKGFAAEPDAWCRRGPEAWKVAVTWSLLSLFAQSGTLLLLDRILSSPFPDTTPASARFWKMLVMQGYRVIDKEWLVRYLDQTDAITAALESRPHIYVYVARVGRGSEKDGDRETRSPGPAGTGASASGEAPKMGRASRAPEDKEDGSQVAWDTRHPAVPGGLKSGALSNQNEGSEGERTREGGGEGKQCVDHGAIVIRPSTGDWDSYHVTAWCILRSISEIAYALAKNYDMPDAEHAEVVRRLLWSLSPTYQPGLSQDAASGLEELLVERFSLARPRSIRDGDYADGSSQFIQEVRRWLQKDDGAKKKLPLCEALQQWAMLWGVYKTFWVDLFQKLLLGGQIPLVRRGGITPLCLAALISAMVKFPGSLGGLDECQDFIRAFGIRTVYNYDTAPKENFYLLPRQPGVLLAQGIVYWFMERLQSEEDSACVQALHCLVAIAARLPVPAGGKGLVLCEELLLELYSGVLVLLRAKAQNYVIRNGCYLLTASLLRRASSLRGLSAFSLCGCDGLYGALLNSLADGLSQTAESAPGKVPRGAETCLPALQIFRVCTPKTGPGADGRQAQGKRPVPGGVSGQCEQRYERLAGLCFSLLSSGSVYVRLAAARALPAFYGLGVPGLLGAGPKIRAALAEGQGFKNSNFVQAAIFCVRGMLRPHNKGTGVHLLLEDSPLVPLRLAALDAPGRKPRDAGIPGARAASEGSMADLALADILETLESLRDAARGPGALDSAGEVEILAQELQKCGVSCRSARKEKEGKKDNEKAGNPGGRRPKPDGGGKKIQPMQIYTV